MRRGGTPANELSALTSESIESAQTLNKKKQIVDGPSHLEIEIA